MTDRRTRRAIVRDAAVPVAVSAAIGVGIVSMIVAAAGGRLSLPLVSSGAVVGISIYAGCAVFSTVFTPLLGRLHSPWRQLWLGAVFGAGGLAGWIVARTLNPILFNVHYGTSPRGLAISAAITVSIAIVVGATFTIIETLRSRLEVSIAESAAREYAERELEVAASIQRRLLPDREVDLGRLRVTSRHLPARLVAGDFYDVFRLGDGRVAVVVADVAGKGMGASLIMASAKAMVPLLATGRSLAGTMDALNRRLLDELDRRQFVALAMVWIDPDDGSFELANAGLPDPCVLAPGEPAGALSAPGPRLPLGVRDGLEYAVLAGRLAPDQRLVLMTDGLPEALDASGEPLGYDAIEHAPATAADTGAWLDELIATLRPAGEADDDWTLVTVERT
jgi:hypothetical protein